MTLLTDSIRLYGVLQPLTVQRTGSGWVLVTGERRLRAAKMAGLRQVPCLPAQGGESPDFLTRLEYLRRQDLDFVLQAQSLARLMTEYGLSQQQAAYHLGCSQSALANKLRLLQHPPEILSLLRASRLTERHGRTLLREKDPVRRRYLLERADAEGWTVAMLEAAVAEI